MLFLAPEKGPHWLTARPTVIDHFSTSFNWAQLNFASVLVRGWWYLLSNSSITDVQNGGLQMVTGGGYTRSDVAQGFWNLSSHNLLVGNTQPIIPTAKDGGVPDNPFASNAGPFNPYALGADCPFNSLFCNSYAQGIAFENAGFSNSQRLFNIYDGPTFEDSDAFTDIHTLNIGSLGSCKSDPAAEGSCTALNWMNAYTSGVLQSPNNNNNNVNNQCILPNAAISWKQPNGFYYPPAFNSTNLYFDSSVDIRHFVIDPLWQKGSFLPDSDTSKATYCTWQQADFSNFTDVDRQTELTDLDGSLTGLLEGKNNPTISVNNDPTGNNTFFNAPVITPECESNVPGLTSTVNTSPYEYVTTAIFPACMMADGTGCGDNWTQSCSDQTCYGLPLYRRYLTNEELAAWQSNPVIPPIAPPTSPTVPPHHPTTTLPNYPNIRMMGQDTGQRSSLTMNHVSYYIDTTIPLGVQDQTVANDPFLTSTIASNVNVFAPGQTYYIYFLYATPTLHQTYSLYVGKGLSSSDVTANVHTGIVDPTQGTVPTFKPGLGDSASDWVTSKTYDTDTGVLSVTVDLGQQGSIFDGDRKNFCQPATYCSVHSDNSCGCNPANGQCKDDSVCSWGPKQIDCPVAGCFGFTVTMPSTFRTATADAPILPPNPVLFTASNDPYFAPGNISFLNVSESVAGAGPCTYSAPPTAPAIRPARTRPSPESIQMDRIQISLPEK